MSGMQTGRARHRTYNGRLFKTLQQRAGEEPYSLGMDWNTEPGAGIQHQTGTEAKEKAVNPGAHSKGRGQSFLCQSFRLTITSIKVKTKALWCQRRSRKRSMEKNGYEMEKSWANK